MTGSGTETIAVIGGGSWGTAFAAVQAQRHGEVSLWVREEEICASIRESHSRTAATARAELLGGVCKVEDGSGGGTLMRWRVPLPT